MQAIPTYALFGETAPRHDWLHWETIQSRSRLYAYEITPHRHEELFQILVLTGGRAELQLDETRINLSPKEAVVVPALTVHGYRFSEDVEGMVVTMMERDLIALGLDLPSAGTGPATPALMSALTGLIGEADNPGPSHDVAMRAHLTLVMVALARADVPAATQDETSERAIRHARLFREQVEARFRETRRIADYAEVVGISPTHLNRISRQVLGASALEVVERRILLEARRQLLFSNLGIKQIGAELGYDDPAYFTRFLTRALGVAPGVFRKEGRRRSSAPSASISD